MKYKCAVCGAIHDEKPVICYERTGMTRCLGNIFFETKDIISDTSPDTGPVSNEGTISLNDPQPDPIKGTGRSIWNLVLDDMQERDKTGLKKYGTRLRANNGRDALVDAYQEALDLVVYLRQAIEEKPAQTASEPFFSRSELSALWDIVEECRLVLKKSSPDATYYPLLNKCYPYLMSLAERGEMQQEENLYKTLWSNLPLDAVASYAKRYGATAEDSSVKFLLEDALKMREEKPPQTAHALPDDIFAILLDLFMCSDPRPLEKGSGEILLGFLDDEAKARGYIDWVGAFHREAKPGGPSAKKPKTWTTTYFPGDLRRPCLGDKVYTKKEEAIVGEVVKVEDNRHYHNAYDISIAVSADPVREELLRLAIVTGNTFKLLPKKLKAVKFTGKPFPMEAVDVFLTIPYSDPTCPAMEGDDVWLEGATESVGKVVEVERGHAIVVKCGFHQSALLKVAVELASLNKARGSRRFSLRKPMTRRIKVRHYHGSALPSAIKAQIGCPIYLHKGVKPVGHVVDVEAVTGTDATDLTVEGDAHAITALGTALLNVEKNNRPFSIGGMTRRDV